MWTRRRFIVSSLGLLLPATFLSSCGGATPPPPQGTGGQRVPTRAPQPEVYGFDLFETMGWMADAMGGGPIANSISRWRAQQRGVARDQSDDATHELEAMGFDDVSRSPVYGVENFAVYTAESERHPDLWCMALIPIIDGDKRFAMFEGPTALLYGVIAAVWADKKGVGRATRDALLPSYENMRSDPPIMQPFDGAWQFDYPTASGGVAVSHEPLDPANGRQQGEMNWRIRSNDDTENINLGYRQDTITL